MSSDYSGKKDLSFRQIVLSHLKKILDLTLSPISQHGKIEYVQTYRGSILALSDVLVSFYDEKMTTAYDKFNTEYDSLAKKCCKNGLIEKETSYIIGSKDLSRTLFRELNLLLNRVDYLKTEIYGEDSEDPDIVEEEE